MAPIDHIRRAASARSVDLNDGLWHLWNVDTDPPEHCAPSGCAGFVKKDDASSLAREYFASSTYAITGPDGAFDLIQPEW
jgi:hypothetical protein